MDIREKITKVGIEMITKKEIIWSDNADSFMDVSHTSQSNVLHPLLAKLINEDRPQQLLDFGCGDGRILSYFDSSIAVDVYDKFKEMLILAETKNGVYIRNYYSKLSSLPNEYYDGVLLSMVLMCIDNPAEYLKVLSTIKKVKKVNGKVYIAITHPCFRDKRFSNFSTSFCDKQTFKYNNDGEPFEVIIEDQMPPSVAFTDFHWSLSFTINKIIQAGLEIINIIETPDDKTHPRFNSFFSPYLILIAK